jgi:hypothetical protein
MFKQRFMLLFAVAMLSLGSARPVLAGSGGGSKDVAFKIRVENIADPAGVPAQDGSKYPFALSPGFFVVSKKGSRIFVDGKRASKDLEVQAEDGNPQLLYNQFVRRVGTPYSGLFNKPLGKDMASPIFSGDAFEFEFYASQGMKLNLAFMFGQSNDLFYAPDAAIDLFDAGANPVAGDVTSLFKLWDAGTETNQAPGLGADQGPRQKGANTGPAEGGVVKLVNDGFSYPDTKSVLRVTITPR